MGARARGHDLSCAFENVHHTCLHASTARAAAAGPRSVPHACAAGCCARSRVRRCAAAVPQGLTPRATRGRSWSQNARCSHRARGRDRAQHTIEPRIRSASKESHLTWRPVLGGNRARAGLLAFVTTLPRRARPPLPARRVLTARVLLKRNLVALPAAARAFVPRGALPLCVCDRVGSSRSSCYTPALIRTSANWPDVPLDPSSRQAMSCRPQPSELAVRPNPTLS